MRWPADWLRATSGESNFVVVGLAEDVDDHSTLAVGSELADGSHIVDEALRGREDDPLSCERGLVDRRPRRARRWHSEVGVVRHSRSPPTPKVMPYMDATCSLPACQWRSGGTRSSLSACPCDDERMVAGRLHECISVDGVVAEVGAARGEDPVDPGGGGRRTTPSYPATVGRLRGRVGCELAEHLPAVVHVAGEEHRTVHRPIESANQCNLALNGSGTPPGLARVLAGVGPGVHNYEETISRGLPGAGQ